MRILRALSVSLFLLPVSVWAQAVQNTQNKADSALRTSMRVDPSTLSVGFQLSLGSYPGRAGSTLPINISYSSKVWRMDFEDIGRFPFGSTIDRSRAIPRFAEHSASGWTTNFDIPVLEELRWQAHDAFGAAICIKASCPPPDPQTAILYVYRLLVHMPDGSTHELRRDDTPVNSTTTGSNVYTAVDGSRLRYQESNQTLVLPDGSRYVFASNSVQYIDRNGNTLTYDNNSKQWSDTMGRAINRPPLATTTTGYVTYTIPGFEGSTLTYRLRWRNLADVLTTPAPLRYKGDRTWESQMQTLSPSLFNSGTVPDEFVMTDATALFNPVVLNEVELPNGTRYTFTYNVYGEIDKVVYPTGAYELYQYAPIDGISTSLKRGAYAQANRGVVDRWVSIAGDGSDLAQNHWHYSATHNNFMTPYTVTITAPDGTYTTRLLHGGHNSDMRFGFDDVRNGMAYDESTFSAAGQMLRRSLAEWATSGPLSGGEWTATRDPRPVKQVSIVLDTGTSNALVSTTTMSYDADLNLIATNHYDFTTLSQSSAQTATIGTIAAGALLRTDETTFLVNDTTISATIRQAYRERNLLGLPTSTRVKDGSGTIVAQTQISYDETASYPLLTYGGTLTGWTDPATNLRGLPTTTGVWLSTTGSYVQTHAQYDQFGNVRKIWDAKGNQSQVDYSSTYEYAYPTTTTSAVPYPSGQYGSSVAFVNTQVYDATTGLIVSITDANNQTTTYGYVDPQTGTIESLNRIRTVTRPDGGVTTYNYNDEVGNRYVQTLTQQDSTSSLDSFQFFDKLGRPYRSFLNVGGGHYITSDTQYDNMGRVYRTSNPYISTGSSSAINPADLWTSSGFDALGRVISVITSDNAEVTTSYGASTSAPLGTTVTVTDQSCKVTDSSCTKRQRRSITDARGLLVRVDEPDKDNGNLGDVSSPVQPTYYTYDTLGNLRTVVQGAQTRTFVYDSLSRLQSATNPESGMMCFGRVVSGQCEADGYDDNGNLIYRTDARGILTSYGYDALNRSITVSYTNDPAGTPAVTRTYDSAVNGKGRPWRTETSGAVASRTITDSYDALGRPLKQRQQFGSDGLWSQDYTVLQGYDLAGHVVTQTYPSGHSVSYDYDVAGRTESFIGNLGEGVSRTYASQFRYTERGAIEEEKFGTETPLYHKQRFNQRGQLWDMRLSTVPFITDADNGDRGAIVNYYSNPFVMGGSGADNNGNLLRQEVYVPGSGYFQDRFTYDSLNRMTSISEKINGAGNDTFKQSYQYDRWGNRTIDQAHTTTNVPHPAYTANSTNNRLNAPEGYYPMVYDLAGNLTQDPTALNPLGISTFDAENRLQTLTVDNPPNCYPDGEGGTTCQPAASASYRYVYDGDGRRVRRNLEGLNGSSETWQVYGFAGELLAEYPQAVESVTIAQPQKEYGYRNGQLLVTAQPWTNVALNKPATQTNNFSATTTANKAVNGDASGNFFGGSVSATNYGLNSWWQVDLQTVQSIESITVWGRTDCCPEMTTDFYVFVSDVPFTSTDLNTTLAQSGVFHYHHAGFAGPASLPVDRTGRYVRVQLAGTQYLALGEVQVWSAAANLNWLVTDHLGTPRIIADRTGSAAGVSRHDYLPFGEHLPAEFRSGATGYSASDTVRQKFTQKERDLETGLDYFNARYYSSPAGRFTSTDPIFISDNQTYNPQLWNLYNYVGNNPLNATDPTGMELVQLGQHTDEYIDQRRKAIDEEKKAIRKDSSLTKAQQNEKRAKLEAEKKTLGLEKEGNKVVGQELASLQSHGELNGLKLTDFTLSTDSKHDFDADPRVSDDPGAGATMFTLEGYSTQIYVKHDSNQYQRALSGDADYITFGGTTARHEQVHRDGDAKGDKSEHAAYTEQLRILEKYGPTAFKSKDFYDDAIDFVTKGSKRKD